MTDLTGNKKILIVRLGKIGDIIVTSSIFELLKERYPALHISLLTLNRNKNVLKYNPKIDKIYFVNKNPMLYFTLFKLRKNHYNLLLDLNDDPSTTSGVIRKILRADSTAGFDFGIKHGPGIAVAQPSKEKSHIIDRIKFLLEEVGIAAANDQLKPKLYLGKNENNDVKKQLDSYRNNSKIIAVNLSAGSETRYWDKEKWVELINKISNKYTRYTFLLLSANYDKAFREHITKCISTKKFITQKFDSFQHFAAYICNSDLLLTADTSAVHVASAFNIPQIVLFPSAQWNFVSWKPLSGISRVIRSTGKDINAVSVNEVWNAFDGIISNI